MEDELVELLQKLLEKAIEVGAQALTKIGEYVMYDVFFRATLKMSFHKFYETISEHVIALLKQAHRDFSNLVRECRRRPT